MPCALGWEKFGQSLKISPQRVAIAHNMHTTPPQMGSTPHLRVAVFGELVRRDAKMRGCVLAWVFPTRRIVHLFESEP
jgi:hypothetical protein